MSFGLPWRLLLVAICLPIGFSESAWAQSATDAIPDTIAQRVLACASCHGAKGEGTDNAYFPRLAGKPAGYLKNQLVAFKNGRRHYPPMNYLLEFLTDDYLGEMAEFFAAQRPPLPAAAVADVSAEVLEHGKALVTQGDANRGVPACQSCHGTALTGMEPGIPGLLGLRASYISAQLGGWRYGTRTAGSPDCMQIVAGHLTEDDVKSVAAFLAAQPAAKNPAPVAKGTYALPFTCGSQPQ